MASRALATLSAAACTVSTHFCFWLGESWAQGAVSTALVKLVGVAVLGVSVLGEEPLALALLRLSVAVAGKEDCLGEIRPLSLWVVLSLSFGTKTSADVFKFSISCLCVFILACSVKPWLYLLVSFCLSLIHI